MNLNYTQIIQHRPEPLVALIVHQRSTRPIVRFWRWGFVVRVGRLAFRVECSPPSDRQWTWRPGVIRYDIPQKSNVPMR